MNRTAGGENSDSVIIEEHEHMFTQMTFGCFTNQSKTYTCT